MKTIRAIYERGVFIPMEPVELPEFMEVELEAHPVSGDTLVERKLVKIAEILNKQHAHGNSRDATC